MKAEIEYNLHDATIVSAFYVNPSRMELVVQLYEVFYPGSPMMKVSISGIFTVKKAQEICDTMNNHPFEDQWLGYRIDKFKLDTKTELKTRDLHIVIGIDHLAEANIHCKKISFCKIAENT